jgi:anti-sigma B factor antagonist
MMTIESERLGKSVMVVTLEGRLDTATAPQLERKLKQWGDDITEVILDFSLLTYISSMGLRVLLQAQKAMHARGCKFSIKNMNQSVREVFEMTGFINLMVQEEKFVVIKKETPDQITLNLIGRMDGENVPAIRQELDQIREAGEAKEALTRVTLDLGKLTFISPGACKLLKNALEESRWDKRVFGIEHTPEELRAPFEAEGMGDLLRRPDEGQ